jgi:hypothetical protein
MDEYDRGYKDGFAEGQKKRCNLQSGSCVNLNKWRMPE